MLDLAVLTTERSLEEAKALGSSDRFGEFFFIF